MTESSSTAGAAKKSRNSRSLPPCKGCKTECPVSVDVATYKSEFLSHYYEGRLRPRSAYAFGNIDLWAPRRISRPRPRQPGNSTAIPRDVSKLIAGIPTQRSIPAFATETFKTWFYRRRKDSVITGGRDAGFERARLFSRAVERGENGALAPEGKSVLLWPDTFNNYFHPALAIAAVEVLEAAGFRVTIPSPISAVAAHSTTTVCSPAPKDFSSKFLTNFPPKSTPAFPSSASNPVVSPSFATNS